MLLVLWSCESKDIEIAKESIARDQQNFYKLPKDLQLNKEIALFAIEKYESIYNDIDISLKEDITFVKQAMDRNYHVFPFLSDKLMKNREHNREIFFLYERKLAQNIDKLKELVRNQSGIEMILISGGSFMMGSDVGSSDEKPVHSVKVRNFFLSRTEVTVGQYRKCVDANVCSKPYNNHDIKEYCNWEYSDRENHPINCVNWNQARTFARWVGGDLPSEAQWEYASRSEGKDIKYPWGNAEATCEYAVMGRGCGKGGLFSATWEVCSKTKGNTVQGLCDMSGNVEEWVLDEKHESYNAAPSNDMAWCSVPNCESVKDVDSRVFRGGTFMDMKDDLRSVNRDGHLIQYLNFTCGFRVRW